MVDRDRLGYSKLKRFHVFIFFQAVTCPVKRVNEMSITIISMPLCDRRIYFVMDISRMVHGKLNSRKLI